MLYSSQLIIHTQSLLVTNNHQPTIVDSDKKLKRYLMYGVINEYHMGLPVKGTGGLVISLTLKFM